MKKTLARILTVIIIAAVALTAVGCEKDEFAPPKGMVTASDDTATFYLYVPDNWTVDYTTGTGGAYFSSSDPSSVFATAWEMPNSDSTVEDWWAINLPEVSTIFGNFQLLSEDTTVVDGLEARSYVYTGDLGEYSYKFMQVAFIKDGSVYLITYSSTIENFDSHMGDVEKVLEYFTVK